MDPDAQASTAARVTGIAGAILGIAGLILVFGGEPAAGIAGIGSAVQTVLGGALLVMAALVGLTSALLWLLGQRRHRRQLR